MGDVADVIGGGTPSTARPEYFGGEIPWLTPADLSGYRDKYIGSGARSITEAGLANSGARMLPAGSVLFSSRAPIGYVAIAANPVATNQGFKSFVLNDDLLPDFVYYYLQHARQLAIDLASGTTFLEISGKKAMQIPVPVPSLDEQRAIVGEIETQFTRLDAGVAALQRAQANLKRYRASVLKAACEGRLVPTEAELARREGRDYETGAQLLERILSERRKAWTGKGKYKEPEPPDTMGLRELPEGWCWASVGQVGTVHVGATPSRKEPSYWGGCIPWVSSGEVAFCRIKVTRETISATGLARTSTEVHPPGTVLIGMIGEGRTRGQVAMLDIGACNNQNCAAIRLPQADVIPEYVYHFLEGRYEITRKASSGNNQPALNKARVEAMPLPLAPTGEQARIVIEIGRCVSLAEHLSAACTAALRAGDGLRRSALHRAFAARVPEPLSQ